MEFLACSLRTCNDRLHLAHVVSRLVSRFRMFFLPSVCSGLCCLRAGSGISAGLSVSRCHLGDLIGESARATLPAMSAKMAIISWSETIFAMV